MSKKELERFKLDHKITTKSLENSLNFYKIFRKNFEREEHLNDVFAGAVVKYLLKKEQK